MNKYAESAPSAEVETENPKNVPTYIVFALIATIINLPLGLLALLFSYETKRCKDNGWKLARRYSDLAFGFSVLAIIGTILTIVLVYAFGHFPDDTYYSRDDIIRGYSTTSTTTVVPMTTA